jgi:hypothetical protein
VEADAALSAAVASVPGCDTPASGRAVSASIGSHPFWELAMACGEESLPAPFEGFHAPVASVMEAAAAAAAASADASAGSPADKGSAGGGKPGESESPHRGAAPTLSGRAVSTLLCHALAARGIDATPDGDAAADASTSPASLADGALRAYAAGVRMNKPKPVGDAAVRAATEAAASQDILDYIVNATSAVFSLPIQLASLALAEGAPSPKPLMSRAAALLLLLVHGHRRQAAEPQGSAAAAGDLAPGRALQPSSSSSLSSSGRHPAATENRSSVNPYRQSMEQLSDTPGQSFGNPLPAEAEPAEGASGRAAPIGGSRADISWIALHASSSLSSGGDVGLLVLYTLLYCSPPVRAALTASPSAWFLRLLSRVHELSEGGESSRPGAKNRRIVLAVTALLASQAARMLAHLHGADGGGSHAPQWLCRCGSAGSVPLVDSARAGAVAVIVLSRAAQRCVQGGRAASRETFTLSNLVAALANATVGLVDADSVTSESLVSLFAVLARRACRAAAMAKEVAASRPATATAPGVATAAAGGATGAAVPVPVTAAVQAARLEAYGASLSEQLFTVSSALRSAVEPGRIERNVRLVYALVSQAEALDEALAAATAAAAAALGTTTTGTGAGDDDDDDDAAVGRSGGMYGGWPSELRAVLSDLASLTHFASLRVQLTVAEEAEVEGFAASQDAEAMLVHMGSAVKAWMASKGCVSDSELLRMTKRLAELRGTEADPGNAAGSGAVVVAVDADGGGGGGEEAVEAADAVMHEPKSAAPVAPAAAPSPPAPAAAAAASSPAASGVWSAGWTGAAAATGGFLYDEEGAPERFFLPRVWSEAIAATGDLGWTDPGRAAKWVLLQEEELAEVREMLATHAGAMAASLVKATTQGDAQDAAVGAEAV